MTSDVINFIVDNSLTIVRIIVLLTFFGLIGYFTYLMQEWILK